MNEKERLKEIVSVIREHDLFKDKSYENIRLTIEDLGPTFVKMGQILSAREDLIPRGLAVELKKLKCSVKSMDMSLVREILESEYGEGIDNIFSSFEEVPIGSASIAQTHLAVLKNGDRVAVKVQRKDIYEKMTMDTRLIKKAISILQLDKIFSSVVDLPGIIDEMYKAALEEMDFLIEASHLEEFANNNSDVLYIRNMHIYREYSNHRVLVMEYVDGYFINEVDKLKDLGYDMEEISVKLADNYIKQAIDDGYYHADPHSDNIKICDGKIVYLDFGMMGRLNSRDKGLMNECMKCILKGDVSGVAHVLTTLNTSHNSVDYMKLTRDISNILSKNDTASIVNIDIKDFVGDMFLMLNSNHITLPKDITMLIRGIVVLEGVLEEINPSISLMAVLKNRVRGNIHLWDKDSFDKLLLKGVENGQAVVGLPSEFLRLIRAVNNGEMRFNIELTDSNNQVNRFVDIFHQAIITILDVAFIISISLMCVNNDGDMPFIFYLYVFASVIFTGWLFMKMCWSRFTRKK